MKTSRISPFILFLWFLFFSFSGFGQTENSCSSDEKFLKYVASVQYSTETVEILKELINCYKTSHPKPTRKQEIYQLYGEMILHYLTVGNPEMMVSYGNQIIQKVGNSQDVNFNHILFFAYYIKAGYQIVLNADHEVIVKNYNRALEIAKFLKSDNFTYNVYAAYAQFHQAQHDYDEADKYLKLAIKLQPKNTNQLKLARAKIFLMKYKDTYQVSKLDSAKFIISEIIRQSNNPDISDAYALDAFAEILQENYQGALQKIDSSFLEKHYSTATQIFIRDDFRNGIKAIAYFKMNDPVNGQRFLSEVDISNPNGLIAEMLYQEIYKAEKNAGRYKEALEYYEKANEMEKQTYFLNNQLQIRKFQEKLKISEKNAQLAELQNNKKTLTIILIIGLNLLLGGLFYSIYASRKRKKEMQEIQLQIENFTENEIYKINYEKEEAVNNLKKKFSVQLHNDVGSMLMGVSNFLKAKKCLEEGPEQIELWDSVIGEVQKVYSVIRSESHEIYDSSQNNKKFLEDLEQNITTIFGNSQIEMQTEFLLDADISLPAETKLCLLSMIREGSTNILKYAKGKGASILLYNEKNKIHLKIKNEGSPKKKSIKYGFGLTHLKKMVEDIGGIFTVQSNEKGFEISAEI